jgi:hypothetical protein
MSAYRQNQVSDELIAAGTIPADGAEESTQMPILADQRELAARREDPGQ